MNLNELKDIVCQCDLVSEEAIIVENTILSRLNQETREHQLAFWSYDQTLGKYQILPVSLIVMLI